MIFITLCSINVVCSIGYDHDKEVSPHALTMLLEFIMYLQWFSQRNVVCPIGYVQGTKAIITFFICDSWFCQIIMLCSIGYDQCTRVIITFFRFCVSWFIQVNIVYSTGYATGTRVVIFFIHYSWFSQIIILCSVGYESTRLAIKFFRFCVSWFSQINIVYIGYAPGTRVVITFISYTPCIPHVCLLHSLSMFLDLDRQIFYVPLDMVKAQLSASQLLPTFLEFVCNSEYSWIWHSMSMFLKYSNTTHCNWHSNHKTKY